MDAALASLDAIDTPTPLLDRRRLEQNIARLQAYCDEHRIALWPHAKTHKSPEIARRQLRAGAAGLTAAKPTEAEAMLESGTQRLLIAFPVLGPEKARLVAELAGRCDLSVAIDSVTVADSLAAAARRRGTTVGLLLELDVGLHRVGRQGVDDLLELAKNVEHLRGVEVQGIACYPGHLRKADELVNGARAVEHILNEAVSAFAAHGISTDRVSAGSSPTAFITHLMPTVTESRAGTYVLGDLSDPPPDSFALTVLARVVSTAVPGKAVIDAGTKTLSSDRALSEEHAPFFGRLEEADCSPLVELFEEHGIVEVSGRERPLAVGDLVRIVPNHCCAVMNLHDEVVVVEGNEVVDTWPITARGLSR